MTQPTRVFLNDVAPRDGFQNEKTFIATAAKIGLIDALSQTGLAKIEATSFVSPKAIPALAVAAEVMHGITRAPGVVYTVLVPSARGGERVLLARCAAVLIEHGARGVKLCDTTGMAYLAQVTALTEAFARRFPGSELTLHFHDTRGMALANVMAGVAADAQRFDAALGGLGGCPYAPGTSGNACLEDRAHMLQFCGLDTGVDLARLVACARPLPALGGHDIPSQTAKAGRRLELHPLPPSFSDICERAHARVEGGVP